MSRWVAVSSSQRGARHLLRSEPSEDRHASGVVDDVGVIVIADGHGSPRCTRAGTGAAIATRITYDELMESSGPASGLPKKIVGLWRCAVDKDLATHPPTAAEEELAPTPHHLLYGTTVIGVRAAPDTLRIVQIGDGDVLLGRVGSPGARRPVPQLPDARPGETDSLCQTDAADRATVAEYDLVRTPVDVVLVATDGLDAAFEDPDWHDATIADLLQRLPSISAADLEEAVASWCRPPAEAGGDDTTIALLVRRELLADSGGITS